MTSDPQPPGARPRRRRRWRWLLVLAFAWWGAGLLAAHLATRGRPVAIPLRNELAGLPVEDAVVPTADGLRLAAWFVPAGPRSRDAVVLVAGIRGNRLVMAERAAWYLARGWSVLLLDLRATGASEGSRIGFGWHEAKDLQAAMRWLRWRGMARVGAHGQSLGAAAIAFSQEAWDFVVLEACYRDLDSALAARLPWLPVPEVALWPLRVCGAWLADVDPSALRPVDALRTHRASTLLLVGGTDAEVGPAAGERLLAACGAADKRLVTVSGVGHQDLFVVARDAVVAALSAFVPPAR